MCHCHSGLFCIYLYFHLLHRPSFYLIVLHRPSLYFIVLHCTPIQVVMVIMDSCLLGSILSPPALTRCQHQQGVHLNSSAGRTSCSSVCSMVCRLMTHGCLLAGEQCKLMSGLTRIHQCLPMWICLDDRMLRILLLGGTREHFARHKALVVLCIGP